MPQRVFLCRSHPDFHLPPDVDVGGGFDGDAYAHRLKSCGADAVAVFAKCHYGHSYYYTDISDRHPRLHQDMLAETVRGCRKHDLGVIAYYSVFLDTAAWQRNPSWRLQARGKTAYGGSGPESFLPICVNSPYLRERMIPQCREVLTRYEVDELLLDTMTGFEPCTCPTCREKFGREIPADSTDPNWLDYVQWYCDCYERFYAEMALAMHDANPDVAVAFNWEWGFRRPADPPPHIGRIIADLIATPTVATLFCRYAAGTGLPYDYMCGRFMHGLDEWNSNTRESLLVTASATVANGGSFYMIDRQLPDGSLEDRAYEAMQEVFDELQQLRPWLVDARHVPEVAVLHSYRSVMGDRLQFFPDAKARADRLKPYEGLVRLCMEHHRHFTALNETKLLERLSEYRVVILPEQEFLSAELKRALADFVERGGALLLSQAPGSAPDPDLLDLAGVGYDGHYELPYGYLGTTPPLLLRGSFAKVQLRPGAECLCPSVRPLAAGGTSGKFGHGYAPPAQGDGRPLITSRRVGAGQVIYMAVPFFRAYFDHQNPAQACIFLDLLDRLLPDPIARLKTRAQAELSVMRKDNDLIIHVVSHAGRERLGNYWGPVIEYLPEIRDIELSIRHTGAAPARVLSVPDGRVMEGRFDQGYIHVKLEPLETMRSVCVREYFADARMS